MITDETRDKIYTYVGDLIIAFPVAYLILVVTLTQELEQTINHSKLHCQPLFPVITSILLRQSKDVLYTMTVEDYCPVSNFYKTIW